MLNPKEIEEIVDQTFEYTKSGSPGSVYWRMAEVFRNKLTNDKDGIFDDRFADGLSDTRKKAVSLERKYLLISYTSAIVLLALLSGYALPISFPYIGSLSTSPHGLLEIVLITFFIAQANQSILSRKICLYQILLRVFVNVRYNQNVRDFYLLKWGVDDLSLKLDNKKYEGYSRIKDQYKLEKILSNLFVVMTLILILTSVILILLGFIEVVRHPSFGWFSYLIVIGSLIYYLYNLTRNLMSNLRDIYKSDLT